MKALMLKYDFDEFEAILGGLMALALFSMIVEMFIGVFR